VGGPPPGGARRRAILEYNRQRRKTFSQLMREGDALEELWGAEAGARRLANLRRRRVDASGFSDEAECRNSDARERRADPDRALGDRGPGPQPGRGPAAAG